MAKYSNTKAKINEKITTNGAQAVTGSILNDVLQTMVDSLGADYQFGGLVQPGSSFTAGEQPVVFLATTPGTYTNFGGLVVADGEVALLVWSGSAWSKQTPDIATRTQVNQLGQIINNPEWLRIITDKDGRILVGIKSDGSIDWMLGIPTPIREALDGKVNKESGKSLINSAFASLQNVIENPEWLQVTIDEDGKIIEGIKRDGTKFVFTNLIQESYCIARNINEYSELANNGFWDNAIAVALSENNCIFIPDGEYNISSQIIIPKNNITIIASKNARIYHVVNKTYINHQDCRIIYAENKNNITIIGGYWDAHTKIFGELTREHSCRGTLSFLGCSRLTIKDCTLNCVEGSFCIQPDSCSSMTISNIFFDNAYGCGVQVGGNTHNFHITNLSGNTHDDFVALNGYDWWTSSAEIGTIQCGKVENLYPNSATAAVRINIGVANKDGQQYIGCVKDIIIENIYGSYSLLNAVHIGTEADEYGTMNPLAYADNITIKNVNCQPISGVEYPSIRVFGHVGTLTLENIADSNVKGLLEIQSYGIIKTLKIKDYIASGELSILVNGSVNKMILENVQKDSESQESFMLISGTYGSVHNVVIKDSVIHSGYSIISVTDGVLNKGKYENCDFANTRLICNYNNNVQTMVLIDNTDLQSIIESQGTFTIKNYFIQ